MAWKDTFLPLPQNVGVPCKVLAPLPKKTKLGAKTMDCIFIGYASNNSAYRFLVHKLEIPDIYENMIIESRDIVFFEDIFSYKRETNKTSGKRTHEMAFRDESPEERFLMRKLNQEEVRDLESQNLLVQIS